MSSMSAVANDEPNSIDVSDDLIGSRVRGHSRKREIRLLFWGLPIIIFVLVAVFGPILVPYDSVTVRTGDRLKAPGAILRDGSRAWMGIVTKGGMIWDDKAFITGLDSSLEHLTRGLDESLARLQTDHVDLFLLHWPDGETPMAEIAGSLESLVDAGKARAIGVCNLDAAQLREIATAATHHPIVASQVGFSLFDRRWADETFTLCDKLGIGVMAYGPLAHGLLTGAYGRETTFDDRDWRKTGVIFGQPLLTPENRDRNLDAIESLGNFAAKRGISLVQLAIAWVLAHEPVTVALTGARNTQEILGCANAAGVALDKSELAEIDAIMANAAGMTDVLPTGGTSKATATKQGA